MSTCRFALLLLTISLASGGGGCTGMRFVVDAVPSNDQLTESVVMEDSAGGLGKSKIAMIDVTGLIADAEKPGLLSSGENPVARFTESLNRAAKDSSVKAVVIRINSPGGTVNASDVMYREVLYFKKSTGKPVVMSMADVAASGGYYLACAGDEIIASPTTITGSIGVIIQTINFYEGMKKIGIKAEALTSGPNKDMGTPFEPMTEEHRKLLQGIVDDFYANFKNVVVSNRKTLSPSDLSWITDGRVVTGQRASEVGLVDRLGDLRDAFEAAKTRADVKSAKLVKYHRPIEYVGSPYASAPIGGSQLNMMQLNIATGGMSAGDAPGFYYLWDPAVW